MYASGNRCLSAAAIMRSRYAEFGLMVGFLSTTSYVHTFESAMSLKLWEICNGRDGSDGRFGCNSA